MEHEVEKVNNRLLIKVLAIPLIVIAYLAYLTFQLSLIQYEFLDYGKQQTEITQVVNKEKDFKLYILVIDYLGDQTEEKEYGIEELMNNYQDNLSSSKKQIESIEDLQEQNPDDEYVQNDLEKEKNRLERLQKEDPVGLALGMTKIAVIDYKDGKLSIHEIVETEPKRKAIEKIFAGWKGNDWKVKNKNGKTLYLDVSYTNSSYGTAERLVLKSDEEDKILIPGQKSGSLSLINTSNQSIRDMLWVDDENFIFHSTQREYIDYTYKCENSTSGLEKLKLSLLYTWPNFTGCKDFHVPDFPDVKTLSDLQKSYRTSFGESSEQTIPEKESKKIQKTIDSYEKLYSGTKFFKEQSMQNIINNSEVVLMNSKTGKWIILGNATYTLLDQ